MSQHYDTPNWAQVGPEGKEVHFTDGDIDVSHLTVSDLVPALSKLCRFNGHCRGFYSVAEHSVLVAALVPRPFRREALLHDIAEALTGDLITPIKHGIKGTLIKRVEKAVAEHFQIPYPTSELVKEADLQALAIECVHLMSPSRPWPVMERGYDLQIPDSITFLGRSPAHAEQKWFEFYGSL